MTLSMPRCCAASPTQTTLLCTIHNVNDWMSILFMGCEHHFDLAGLLLVADRSCVCLWCVCARAGNGYVLIVRCSMLGALANYIRFVCVLCECVCYVMLATTLMLMLTWNRIFAMTSQCGWLSVSNSFITLVRISFGGIRSVVSWHNTSP